MVLVAAWIMFTEKLNKALVIMNGYCIARVDIVERKIKYVVSDYFTTLDTFSINILYYVDKKPNLDSIVSFKTCCCKLVVVLVAILGPY